MPTDNSRMVFFPSMLAKYSTVDKLCPACRVQVPRIRAMRLPCRQHAFLCAGLYAHPRLRPPRPISARSIEPFSNSIQKTLGRVRSSSAAKGEALSANGKAEVQLTPR